MRPLGISHGSNGRLFWYATKIVRPEPRYDKISLPPAFVQQKLEIPSGTYVSYKVLDRPERIVKLGSILY